MTQPSVDYKSGQALGRALSRQVAERDRLTRALQKYQKKESTITPGFFVRIAFFAGIGYFLVTRHDQIQDVFQNRDIQQQKLQALVNRVKPVVAQQFANPNMFDSVLGRNSKYGDIGAMSETDRRNLLFLPKSELRESAGPIDESEMEDRVAGALDQSESDPGDYREPDFWENSSDPDNRNPFLPETGGYVEVPKMETEWQWPRKSNSDRDRYVLIRRPPHDLQQDKLEYPDFFR